MKFLFLILFCFKAQGFDHHHSDWGVFLKKFVVSSEHSSQVRYREAQKDRKELDQYIDSITAVTKKEYQSFSPEQKQAFLINAYNALTVKLILDKNIPDSIKSIGNLFKNTWKIKFFKFLEEDSYLDRIEHEIARTEFVNCRFHFAFNCASIGCPALRAEPWMAEKLTEQFEDSAKKFVSDTSRNSYDPKSDSLQLSKIFDWYKKDFEKDPSCGGSVQAFVAKYLAPAKNVKIDDKTKVKYLDYNWNLNIRE